MCDKFIVLLSHAVSVILGAFLFVLDIVECVWGELLRAMDYWMDQACKPEK